MDQSRSTVTANGWNPSLQYVNTTLYEPVIRDGIDSGKYRFAVGAFSDEASLFCDFNDFDRARTTPNALNEYLTHTVFNPDGTYIRPPTFQSGVPFRQTDFLLGMDGMGAAFGNVASGYRNNTRPIVIIVTDGLIRGQDSYIYDEMGCGLVDDTDVAMDATVACVLGRVEERVLLYEQELGVLIRVVGLDYGNGVDLSPTGNLHTMTGQNGKLLGNSTLTDLLTAMPTKTAESIYSHCDCKR